MNKIFNNISFLLCFLSLVFSIYCIGVQQTIAASKSNSVSCNPWEEEKCPFSQDYLNELTKYYESDRKPNKSLKPFPNQYYQPPQYVDQIIKVAKDLGKELKLKL